MKSFFSTCKISASGSNSGQSIPESANVAESEEQEELGGSEPYPVETIQGVEDQEPQSHKHDVEGTVLRLLT